MSLDEVFKADECLKLALFHSSFYIAGEREREGVRTVREREREGERHKRKTDRWRYGDKERWGREERGEREGRERE